MINPFEIVKTDWVYPIDNMPNVRSRIVAPMWIAWILVKFNYIKLGRVSGYWFGRLARWSGAYIQQEMTVKSGSEYAVHKALLKLGFVETGREEGKVNDEN